MHPTRMAVENEVQNPCNANLRAAPTCIISVSLSDLTSDHHLQSPQIPFSHLHLSYTTSDSPSSTFFYCLSLFPTLYLHTILQLHPYGQNVLHNKRNKNLTFLGFCKITPSTISLMILLYRQTEGYSNTTKATLTWTVNRQNYASNLHIKQLFLPKTPEFPHIDCLQSSNTGGICKNA